MIWTWLVGVLAGAIIIWLVMEIHFLQQERTIYREHIDYLTKLYKDELAFRERMRRAGND